MPIEGSLSHKVAFWLRDSRMLFEDGSRKTGAASKEDDLKELFVSAQEGKFTRTTYEKIWQNLRERSGLGNKRKISH